jgi:hypothetical protein
MEEAPVAVSGEREYTPEKLTKENMPTNGVFVFGSNTEGRHGLGAAKDAKNMFGALQGQAEGLQGKSYAIVTKNLTSGVEMFGRKITKTGERSIERFEIREQLEDLMEFAENNLDKKFYVSKLGSSLAGYSVEEIKDLFEKIKDAIPSNVILPKEYEVRSTQPVNEYGLTAENFESTVPDYVMAISNFYEDLTPEQKTKLGSLDDIMADYENIPFDYSYDEYIESLKCKL